MNRLGGDLDVAGELAGVGKTAGLERLVDAQHPLQRRAGVQGRWGRSFLRRVRALTVQRMGRASGLSRIKWVAR